MLSTGATRLPTYTSERPSYTVASSQPRSPGERVIPIETTAAFYRV
jgi:hypothetical protein